MTRKEAMVVAVDPRVIPLGSQILLLFEDQNLRKYNGVYTAKDIGGGIKGKHIDLFMGDFRDNKESKVTRGFGVRTARAIVLP